MDQSEQLSSEEKEHLAGETMESLGEPESVQEGMETGDIESEAAASQAGNKDPLYVQKRLKKQERSHQRQMREMQAQMEDMRARLGNSHGSATNNYDPLSSGDEDDDRIRRAVSMALRDRDEKERQHREAERMAHVHKQYEKLQEH